MMDRIRILIACYFLFFSPLVICQEEQDFRIRGSSSSSNIKEQRIVTSENKIVGGSDASRGEYPWLVALYKTLEPGNFLPICQGTLITPQIVLTAAHCIDGVQSAEVGNYDYVNDRPSQIETFTFEGKLKHPFYSDYDMDFGLILLNRPHPNPSLVSITYSPEIPQSLKIMGFGQTQYNGTQPYILQEATVQRTSNEECQRKYGLVGVRLTESMFCARAPGIDACQGDSGGPIVREGTNIQIGVVSWGIECARERFPGVYARVNVAYEWINEVACSWDADSCSRNRVDMVNEVGQPIRRADKCQDIEGDFMGLGKKGKRRNCAWVAEKKDRRCRWYGELYCPAKCDIERCR